MPKEVFKLFILRTSTSRLEDSSLLSAQPHRGAGGTGIRLVTFRVYMVPTMSTWKWEDWSCLKDMKGKYLEYNISRPSDRGTSQ